MAFGSKKFSELVKEYEKLSEQPQGMAIQIKKLEEELIDKMQRKESHEQKDMESLYNAAMRGSPALGGKDFINRILSDQSIQDPYIATQREAYNIKSYKHEIENYKKLLESGSDNGLAVLEQKLIDLTKKVLKIDAKHPFSDELYKLADEKRPELLVKMAEDKDVQMGKLQGVRSAIMDMTNQPATFINITKSLSGASNEFARIRASMGADNVSDIGLQGKKELQEALLIEYPVICGVIVNKSPEKNEYGKFLKDEETRKSLDGQYQTLETLRSDVRNYVKENIHDAEDLQKQEVKENLLNLNAKVLNFTKSVMESEKGMAQSLSDATKGKHIANINKALEENEKKQIAAKVSIDSKLLAGQGQSSARGLNIKSGHELGRA